MQSCSICGTGRCEGRIGSAQAFASSRPPLDTQPTPTQQVDAVPASEFAQAPPPSCAAPPVAVAQPLPSLPPKCTWLAAEGLRLEAKAVELERVGSNAEGAFHHRCASTKLAEAAALCPEDHPDCSALSEHAQQVSARAVYLDSLAGAPASLPLEDHVGEISLLMDLTSAPRPEEEDVPALIARAGTSGDTAALTQEGFQLVRALRSLSDVKAFIDRLLFAEGRKRQEVADISIEAVWESAGSLPALQEALRCAPWVELDVDPNMDKLDLAMKFEREAHTLETQGRKEDAKQMYSRALAVLQFVHKHDPRTKNPKIKDMIGKRLQELAVKVG